MSEKEIQQRIARLRRTIWKDRTEEQKKTGSWPPGLDYEAMNHIEELEEKLKDATS